MQSQSVAPALSQAATAAPARRGLSQSASAWSVLWATSTKDLRVARRYMPNLIGRFVDLAIRLVFFVVLASIISVDSRQIGGQLNGRNLYIYFSGALVLFMFQSATLWGPINAVTTDLYNGTLEYIYSNPCSRYAYYVGTVQAQVIMNVPVFLPFYIILIVYSQVNFANMLLILLVCAVTLVTLTAMGILISLLAILWRQASSMAGIVERFFEFLSGAYLPLTAFPLAIQYIGYLLPYTWSYDLIRYYSIEGTWQTLLPVWQEWIALCVYALLYLAISRYLLARVEQLAKRTGLHVI